MYLQREWDLLERAHEAEIENAELRGQLRFKKYQLRQVLQLELNIIEDRRSAHKHTFRQPSQHTSSVGSQTPCSQITVGTKQTQEGAYIPRTSYTNNPSTAWDARVDRGDTDPTEIDNDGDDYGAPSVRPRKSKLGLNGEGAATAAGGAGLDEVEKQKHHYGNEPNLAKISTSFGMNNQSPYDSTGSQPQTGHHTKRDLQLQLLWGSKLQEQIRHDV